MQKRLISIGLNELAKLLEGEVKGDDVQINDVAGVSDVEQGEITWAENRKTFEQAQETKAAAIIISDSLFKEFENSIKVPVIVVKSPRFAYAKTLATFYGRRLPERGISKTAIIGKNVKIGKNVSIGDYAVIGEDSEIGDGATIFPQVYIGNEVKFGEDSTIYPFAVINNRSVVGKRVIIHSGAVIGADGFGFVEVKGTQTKVPQVGIAELGDDVEIGANVTIDRASTGVTHIGSGSKIDNLVQVGHNCKVGKNCILVSQSGIAGSTVLGDNVVLAAQAGTVPHTTIGNHTMVAGRGGVTHDIPANSVVSGFPAKPHKEALKIGAAVQRLPSTMRIIKDLERRIELLEQKNGEK